MNQQKKREIRTYGKGEPSLKLLLSVPRIWVSQPGISHSNANGTPETVSSPKRKKKRTTTARATATAKRKQQQNAKHKTKCKYFLCLFLLSRFSFFMCIYGKMQIATCNNKQHVQADDVWSVCNVCVLHRCSPFPAPSLPHLFAPCHFAAAWVLSLLLLLLLARQFEQPTNCI